MPVLPRPDILDFDGFVMRRGASTGYRNARPPEMRQAALIKNPVSIRRDSAKFVAAPDAVRSHMECTGGEQPSIMPIDSHANVETKDTGGGSLVLSFTFDAVRAGTLSLYVLVTEVERRSSAAPGAVERIELLPQGSDAKGSNTNTKRQDHTLLQNEAVPVVASSTLDEWRFEPGLSQVYESPPLDLSRWPEEVLAFDADRPKDIPVAVRMEVDSVEGWEECIHYTYISVQTRSAHIFAQKLQYGGQCFVLHEVFGVNSKSLDVEVDCGNADCVICLSAPRDTAVLPCRHMCFCSYCAGIVRLQCDRCPVCRQKVASLLQFKREWGSDFDGKLQPAKAGSCAASASPEAAASASVAASATALTMQAKAPRAAESSDSVASIHD